MEFYKVWFTNGKERTAQLIVNTLQYPLGHTSLETYSRLFPIVEAMKMKRLMRTTTYKSFTEAFHERPKERDLCLREEEQFYEYDGQGNILGVRTAER